MSLKDILHNLIKQRGEVSYGELCQITVEQEYKVGNMERRLRELTTTSNGHIPDVKPVLSIGKRRGGKYISGYKWVGEPVKHQTVHATAPQGFSFTYRVHQPITRFNDPS